MSWNYAGRWGADHITNNLGVPLLNTPVSVYLAGTTTPATLYVDREKSATVSSVNTDANGNLFFYADPGLYDLNAGGNITVTVEVETDYLDPTNGLVYNPVDFGADPTGVADSTDAIQQGLYYGRVELPPGTFKVTNLYMPTGSSLIGRQELRQGTWSTNPAPSTVTKIVQPATATGALITLPSTVTNVSIRNLTLDGYYTTSTTNYGINVEDNPTSLSGTTLVFDTLAGATSIVVASVSEIRRAAPLIIGTNYEPAVVSDTWDGSNTTIPLVSPLTAAHPTGSTVIAPAGWSNDTNLRLEDTTIINFAGNYSIYLGRHRGASKLEHIMVFGAGRTLTNPTTSPYVAGTARNPNAVGLFSYASDSSIHASEFGRSASHNIVLACQPFSITECDIWGAGVCGTGNGVRIKAGGSTSRIYIGSRTEFDQSANEAIFVEGQSSDPKGDVQIGPACWFSANCVNGSSDSYPTANVKFDANFIGSASIVGNTAFGPSAYGGGVDYMLSFVSSSAQMSYQGNRLTNMLGNAVNISSIWFGSYSPTGTLNDNDMPRFVNYGGGTSDYIRKTTNDGYPVGRWLVPAAQTLVTSAVSGDTNDRLQLKTDGLYIGSGSASTDANITRRSAGGVKIANSAQIGTGSNLTSGSGAPSGTATTGDIYLRTDTPTTSNQRVYIYNGSAWTGIL